MRSLKEAHQSIETQAREAAVAKQDLVEAQQQVERLTRDANIAGMGMLASVGAGGEGTAGGFGGAVGGSGGGGGGGGGGADTTASNVQSLVLELREAQTKLVLQGEELRGLRLRLENALRDVATADDAIAERDKLR